MKTSSQREESQQVGARLDCRDVLRVKRIAPGYYTAEMEVELFVDGHRYIKTATAEIAEREDGSGWSYTLEVPYAGGIGAKLSAHDDIYDRKKHIIEFFRSMRSRRWEFVTLGGLNCWALKS